MGQKCSPRRGISIQRIHPGAGKGLRPTDSDINCDRGPQRGTIGYYGGVTVRASQPSFRLSVWPCVADEGKVVISVVCDSDPDTPKVRERRRRSERPSLSCWVAVLLDDPSTSARNSGFPSGHRRGGDCADGARVRSPS
jgi:hypothetical protein